MNDERSEQYRGLKLVSEGAEINDFLKQETFPSQPLKTLPPAAKALQWRVEEGRARWNRTNASTVGTEDLLYRGIKDTQHWRQDLKARAERALYTGTGDRQRDDTDTMRFLSGLRIFGTTAFSHTNWSDRPDQLDVLAIALDAYGVRDTTDNKVVNSVLGEMLESGWTSVESVQYRETTIEKVIQLLKKNIGEISGRPNSEQAVMESLEMAVMTVLSVGDSVGAFEIIARAGELSPNISSEQILKRLFGIVGGAGELSTSVVSSVYEVLPPEAQRRLDAVLVMLGSEGTPLSSIQGPVAERLRQEGLNRLRLSFKQEVDTWYGAQRVVPEKREELISEAEIPSLVEKVYTGEISRDALHSDITERIGYVIQGRLANTIAPELVYRLHPELSVDSLAMSYAQRIVGKRGELSRVYIGSGNDYSHELFDYSRFDEDLTPKEKQQIIERKLQEGRYARQGQKCEELLYHPDTIGLGDVVSFLHDPESFFTRLEDSIDTVRRTEQQERLQSNEIEIAKRLLRAIGFIKVALETPETARAIREEFGLASLVSQEKLEAARKTLSIKFNQLITDDEQYQVDAVVMRELSEESGSERRNLTVEVSGMVSTIIAAELQRESQKLRKYEQISVEIQKLNEQIESLNEKINAMENARNGLFGFGKGSDGLTKQQREQALVTAKRQHEVLYLSLKQAYRQLTQLQQDLGIPRNDQEVQELREQIETLRKLRDEYTSDVEE